MYLFSLVVGLGMAIASGFLGHVFDGGDGDVGGVDHDISVDHDIDVGHDIDIGHDIGGGGVGDVGAELSPVSMPIISTFLSGFGMSGMILERALHLPPLLSAPAAVGISIVAAFGVFLLLGKLLSAAQGTSHIAFTDLIGTEATVVTPIPAEGVGEIAYSAATGRGGMPARSESGALIPRHSMVTVTQVVGNTAMVRETIDERLRDLSVEAAVDASEQQPEAPEAETETA